MPLVEFEEQETTLLQRNPLPLNIQLDACHRHLRDLTEEIWDWGRNPFELKKEAVLYGLAWAVGVIALAALASFCIYGAIHTGSFLSKIGWMTPLNQLSPAAHGAAFAASYLMAFSIVGAMGSGLATCYAGYRGVAAVHRRWKHAVEKEATPKEKIEETLQEKRAKLTVVENTLSGLEKLASEHLEILEAQGKRHTLIYERLDRSLAPSEDCCFC